jgi:phage N-6-adenine-methyltransferase
LSLVSHEKKSIDGTSDIWLTPKWLIYALGPFDLDPCAAPSPRPWPTASRHIELPQDGLHSEWTGRVWLNPPYSDATPWLEKMAKHRNGTALIFARVETDAWHRYIWPYAHRVFFPKGRIQFCVPDGTQRNGSGAPSAIVVYSELDELKLRESRINGIFVTTI